MDDMIDFNNLSEEHKKCLIESRILSTNPITRMASTNNTEEDASKSFYSLQAISPLYGFNKTDVNEVKKICEAYKNSSLLKNCKAEVIQEYFFEQGDVKVEDAELIDCTEYKTEIKSSDSPVEKLACPIIAEKINHEFIILNENDFEVGNPPVELLKKSSETSETLNGVSLQEHDYAGLPTGEEEEDNEEIDVVTVPNKNLPVGGFIEINPRSIERKSKFELLPYNKSVEMKSLHRSLQYLKRKKHNSLADHTFSREWDSDSGPKQKSRKQSHYISINKDNGSVLKAFYIDYNLIVCQEFVVSFWMQTPLGI
ncbi:hypothetical protein NQ314_005318 [Rhamnusium bicolor]|uniref:Uncharacterized protein n=1 Tax=Rhamnusium bicolor TaxID=1586634 RepID=A0AAV8ZJH6_9CUCU|nr:hypothetical protein NQ314_005318 [Rhamnusium bicolor]